MADDSVTFEVKLKDLTSGPAGRAAVNLQKVGVAGDALGSKMAGLAKAFGLAYAAKQVFDGAMAAGGYLMGAARDASQLSFALGQLTHGDGRKAMAEIGTLAANLGIDAKDAAKQYSNLLKLQFTEDQSKTWIKLGADMQALGSDAEDVAGILRAVGQIKSKGRLQAEELMQLNERNVSAALINEELQKMLGVDSGSLEKMQKAGKVTAEVAMEAIQRAMMRKLKTTNPGEAAAKYVQGSFAGQMSKTESLFSLLRLGMGGSFERGMGEGNLFGGVEKLLNDPKTIEAIDSIAAGIGSIVSVVGELVLAFADGFFIAFSEMTNSSGKAGLSIDTLVEGMREAIPYIRLMGAMWGIVATSIMNVFSAVGAVVSGFSAMFDTDQMAMIGRFLIDGLVGGIKAGLTSLKELIFNMGASVIGWLRDVLRIRSPSKEMAYLGKMTAEGYQQGIDSLTPTMGAAIPTMSSESAAYSAGKGAAARSGSVAVSGITINVSSPDPQAAGQSVMREFDARFAALMGTYAMGAGA